MADGTREKKCLAPSVSAPTPRSRRTLERSGDDSGVRVLALATGSEPRGLTTRASRTRGWMCQRPASPIGGERLGLRRVSRLLHGLADRLLAVRGVTGLYSTSLGYPRGPLTDAAWRRAGRRNPAQGGGLIVLARTSPGGPPLRAATAARAKVSGVSAQPFSQGHGGGGRASRRPAPRTSPTRPSRCGGSRGCSSPTGCASAAARPDLPRPASG